MRTTLYRGQVAEAGRGAADTGRRRPSWTTLLKWLFALAVIGFGVAYFVRNGPALLAALGEAEPLLLALAVPLAAVSLLFAFDSWCVLWRSFDVRLPVLPGARVFFVSQTGKYLPGSIWPIAAQAAMARRHGLAPAESVVLSLIAMAVSIAVGLAWGGALTVLALPELVVGNAWVALVAILGVLVVLPPVVNFMARLVSRIPWVDATRLDYRLPVALRSAGAQLVNWVLGGLHLWLIVVAFGADPAAALLPALGAFPLAFALGVLLIPFPAGLGVREVVIAVILVGVVDEPTAALAAVASRVIYASCDFALAGVSMLAVRGSATR